MKSVYRLRKDEDFKTLFRTGRRAELPLFRVVYRKNDIGHVRLAFISPASVDKRAVLRNRLRRRAREWARRRVDLQQQPLDIALVFKKGAADAAKKKFYEELENIFNRISRG